MLVIVAAMAGLLCVALWPALPNGDGLGYLKAAIDGGQYAGHLGYVPLLRLLAFGASRPVELLMAARLVSVFSTVIAVLLVALTARRAGGRGEIAAFGLTASFAVLAAGSDVECYAPALACVCALLWALVCGRDWLAGLFAIVATLMHIENLLLVLVLPRRVAAAVLAVVAVIYAALHTNPLGATHGFGYPLRASTPFIALYGAAKALVYAPYPYEASWTRVLAGFAVGALALAALIVLAREGGSPLPRLATMLWVGSYALVGAAFFASDHERWIFLLPLAWVAASRSRHPRHALLLAFALCAVNVALFPRNHDWKEKAQAASAHAREGDLVISPGHGWDEYVGFRDGPRVKNFPLVFHAAALGGRAALQHELRDAIARAPRVLLVRMNDHDPLGWKELRQFGITPYDMNSLLPGARIPLGDGVELLEK